MLRREVAISHRHAQVLMSEQRLYSAKVGSSHDQVTRKAVPQVMEVEVGEPCPFRGTAECLRDHAGGNAWEEKLGIEANRKPPQSFIERFAFGWDQVAAVSKRSGAHV